MTNLGDVLKSRDITLPTKVRLVKDVVYPVYMDVRVGLQRKYGQQSLACYRPWDHKVLGMTE